MSTATESAAVTSPPGTKRANALLWPIVGIIAAIGLLALGYWIAGGKKPERLPTAYGKRRGADPSRSVNGTGVLTELFKAAGHRTTTLNRLSPKLESSDVIVWIPNDFQPPTDEQREFIENWLSNGFGRKAIYVGRDYDSAVAYWEEVLPSAAPEDKEEFQRQLARAKAEHDSSRADMPAKEYAGWFTTRRDEAPRDVRTLEGPWAEGIDASKVEIEIEGRLTPPAAADVTAGDPAPPAEVEVLLESEGDALVTRLSDPTTGDGEIIVVTNGSFLLNYPLANPEHRKLAARLVREIDAGSRVVFIESDYGGPTVYEKEPSGGGASPLEMLKVWPLNAIVLHMTLLGIFYCLAASPIFGRPRELPSEPAADFGKHVAALGELLARTKDRNYALSRLEQYRQMGKRDSGKSHLKSK